jgi:hypothetical protein
VGFAPGYTAASGADWVARLNRRVFENDTNINSSDFSNHEKILE